MADNIPMVNELAERVNQLNVESTPASVKVTFAYHVTNKEAELDEDGRVTNEQPQWPSLLWRHVDDMTYDGPILVGSACVFFYTSLYQGALPEKTVYPRYPTRGSDTAHYWRVKVPLTNFNEYEILYVHERTSNGKKQVRLLLVPNEVARQKLDAITLKALKKAAQTYLRRETTESGTVQYYSNDYDIDKTFVAIAVCNDVPLNEGAEWDTVQRKTNAGGQPSREVLRRTLLDATLARTENTLRKSSLSRL